MSDSQMNGSLISQDERNVAIKQAQIVLHTLLEHLQDGYGRSGIVGQEATGESLAMSTDTSTSVNTVETRMRGAQRSQADILLEAIESELQEDSLSNLLIGRFSEYNRTRWLESDDTTDIEEADGSANHMAESEEVMSSSDSMGGSRNDGVRLQLIKIFTALLNVSNSMTKECHFSLLDEDALVELIRKLSD